MLPAIAGGADEEIEVVAVEPSGSTFEYVGMCDPRLHTEGSDEPIPCRCRRRLVFLCREEHHPVSWLDGATDIRAAHAPGDRTLGVASREEDRIVADIVRERLGRYSHLERAGRAAWGVRRPPATWCQICGCVEGGHQVILGDSEQWGGTSADWNVLASISIYENLARMLPEEFVEFLVGEL